MTSARTGASLWACQPRYTQVSGGPAAAKSTLNPQATSFKLQVQASPKPKQNGLMDSFADLTTLIKNKAWTSPAPSPKSILSQPVAARKTDHAAPAVSSDVSDDEAKLEARLSLFKAELALAASDPKVVASDFAGLRLSGTPSPTDVDANDDGNDWHSSSDSSSNSADVEQNVEPDYSALYNTAIVNQTFKHDSNAPYDIREVLYQNDKSKKRIIQMGDQIHEQKMEIAAKKEKIEKLQADLDAYHANNYQKVSQQSQLENIAEKHKEELEKRDV